MSETPQRFFHFIGCEIIHREACYLAATGPHKVDLRFLAKGLHSLETPDMVAAVQVAIDQTDAARGHEAVLLGYARCNDGLVGVQARDLPLVLPKAHDCITFFCGSRSAYDATFAECPGTYFMTTGWAERDDSEADEHDQLGRRKRSISESMGLRESYEDLIAKYGRENADYIVESMTGWERHYSRMLYLTMGICDEAPFVAAARRRAQQHGWSFEQRPGDWSLLRKLFVGDWDEDFLIVPPGGTIVARHDSEVVGLADPP